MKKIAVFLSVLSAGILILFLSLTNDTIQPVSADGEIDRNEESMNGETAVEEMVTISHEEILFLTETFMNILVQETDISGKAVHVNTIEELLSEFDRVATKEVAMPYIDFYYTEEEDGLYLLPTETPPWFEPENDYETERIGESQIKVIQHNTLELYGDYIIEIEFTYTDEWKISNITHR